MYKRMSIKKLGRTTSHRKSLKMNMVRSLVQYGKVKTTTQKAKVLKADMQSLLNKIEKSGDQLRLTRELTTLLGKKELVDTVKRYTKEKGTAVKSVKVSFRDGDNAEMTRVYLPGYKELFKKSTAKVASKKKSEQKPDDKEAKVESTRETPQKGKESDKGRGGKVATKFVSKERSRTRSGL